MDHGRPPGSLPGFQNGLEHAGAHEPLERAVSPDADLLGVVELVDPCPDGGQVVSLLVAALPLRSRGHAVDRPAPVSVRDHSLPRPGTRWAVENGADSARRIEAP